MQYLDTEGVCMRMNALLCYAVPTCSFAASELVCTDVQDADARL